MDIPALEDQLTQLQSEKRQFDESVRSLQEELAKVTKQAAARGAVDALRKQKRTTEEELSNKWVNCIGAHVLDNSYGNSSIRHPHNHCGVLTSSQKWVMVTSNHGRLKPFNAFVES